MQVKYEPETYWQKRLSKDFSLGGVGFAGLGVQYNKWLYRARLRTLNELLRASRIDPKGKTVLDIGVGTGFYIDYWTKRGAKYVKGIDITEKSISSLKLTYPQYDFMKADISSTELPIKEKFDIVTAFDVLFHITEENKFEQAMNNLRSLSHKQTKIFITDTFLKKATGPGFHEYDRTIERYSEALSKVGIEPVVVVPIFYFMNNPIDTSALSSHWLRTMQLAVWRIVSMLPFLIKRLGPLGEVVGYMFGSILYLVDGVILRYAKDGPSTKLMLAQVNR